MRDGDRLVRLQTYIGVALGWSSEVFSSSTSDQLGLILCWTVFLEVEGKSIALAKWVKKTASLIEYSLAVLQIGCHTHRPHLTASDADIAGIFRYTQRALDSPCHSPTDMASNTLHLWVIIPARSQMVILPAGQRSTGNRNGCRSRRTRRMPASEARCLTYVTIDKCRYCVAEVESSVQCMLTTFVAMAARRLSARS